MITQKQIKEWIPGIIDRFKAAVPDIAVPFPEIHIVTRVTWEKARASIVERLQSNQINPGSDAGLETIHGNNGDAILIYQHKLDKHVNDLNDFQHFLWHELGHFYTLNNEDPSMIRFLDQKPHPDEYEALRGYCFWEEFVAEKIACNMDPEPEIDWATTSHYCTRNMLMHLLLTGVNISEDDRIDWYNLAFFFAKIISDKTVLSYCNAIDDGTLRYQISSEGQSIPFKETGMDPLCLDQIDPSVHSYINEIKDILLGQLKKDNPCDISLDTLTLLGEMLLGIEQHATLKERLGLT